MDNTQHLFIAASYTLTIIHDGAEPELVEKTEKGKPFVFISGMGVTLDALEEHLCGLQVGDDFDLTLPPAKAFGEHDETHVVSVSKDLFTIDGEFDSENIYVGNIVPMQNADGNHFFATIMEVGKEQVKIDLNEPLAGKTLRFTGRLEEKRPATEHEVEHMKKMLSGEGCCCGEGGCGGDHHEGGCGGGCHCHEK